MLPQGMCLASRGIDEASLDVGSSFDEAELPVAHVSRKTLAWIDRGKIHCFSLKQKKSLLTGRRSTELTNHCLSTKFRVEPTDFDKKAFKKQRILCNRPYKKERKNTMKILIQRKLQIIENPGNRPSHSYLIKLNIHKKSALRMETKSYHMWL